jgi:hypothetical protein
VEGAEHLVFRGASQLLMSKKSAFYFEFCNDGTRGSDHLRYLPALGYTLLCADAINFRGKSISMEINGMESVVCPLTDTFLRGADQGSVLNILAIPGEQIPSVQHRVTCISKLHHLDCSTSIVDTERSLTEAPLQSSIQAHPRR